jgi:hypothetical protein
MEEKLFQSFQGVMEVIQAKVEKVENRLTELEQIEKRLGEDYDHASDLFRDDPSN